MHLKGSLIISHTIHPVISAKWYDMISVKWYLCRYFCKNRYRGYNQKRSMVLIYQTAISSLIFRFFLGSLSMFLWTQRSLSVDAQNPVRLFWHVSINNRNRKIAVIFYAMGICKTRIMAYKGKCRYWVHLTIEFLYIVMQDWINYWYSELKWNEIVYNRVIKLKYSV